MKLLRIETNQQKSLKMAPLYCKLYNLNVFNSIKQVVELKVKNDKIYST